MLLKEKPLKRSVGIEEVSLVWVFLLVVCILCFVLFLAVLKIMLSLNCCLRRDTLM